MPLYNSLAPAPPRFCSPACASTSGAYPDGQSGARRPEPFRDGGQLRNREDGFTGRDDHEAVADLARDLPVDEPALQLLRSPPAFGPDPVPGPAGTDADRPRHRADVARGHLDDPPRRDRVPPRPGQGHLVERDGCGRGAHQLEAAVPAARLDPAGEHRPPGPPSPRE